MVIHKSVRNFRTRLRNNWQRHQGWTYRAPVRQDRNLECLSLCWHAPLRRDHPGYCTAEIGNPGGTYELPCTLKWESTQQQKFANRLHKTCQRCHYILTFFILNISFIRCSIIFKSQNVCSFTCFVLFFFSKATYLPFTGAYTWRFQILTLFFIFCGPCVVVQKNLLK